MLHTKLQHDNPRRIRTSRNRIETEITMEKVGEYKDHQTIFRQTGSIELPPT